MKIEKEKLIRRELGEVDILPYCKFIKDVKSTMEHPEWLGEFTPDEITDLLGKGSHLYFYEYEGDIVGSSFIIPAREKDIIKFGLDFDYQVTMDYGPEAVADIARGNGIQLLILHDMDEICQALGLRHCVTTVHPDNIFCIKNMEKHGFQYVSTKDFSRGTRNIYVKDI